MFIDEMENKPITDFPEAVSFDKKHSIIIQKPASIHKHHVKKGYLILSKNDFGKVKTRVNLGVFNKKTMFKVGNTKSLLLWDSQENQLTDVNIDVALQEQKRYFMIYSYAYLKDFDNTFISIAHKKDQSVLNLELTRELGYDIGNFLKLDADSIDIPDKYNAIKAVLQIDKNSGRISINKQVLVNSNPSFLIGILEGYVGEEGACILKPDINIYNFSYALNILGAQYSIRTLPEGKQIRFKLPAFMRVKSKLPNHYFREWKYFINSDGETVLEHNRIPMADANKTDFKDLVNSGLIELMPLKDFVFLEIADEVMWDFTMGNPDADNFGFACTPICKNSDGDILAIIGIMEVNSAKECIRKFSTELKDNFLNLATGDVSNWGVQLDSLMGLYTATK